MQLKVGTNKWEAIDIIDMAPAGQLPVSTSVNFLPVDSLCGLPVHGGELLMVLRGSSCSLHPAPAQTPSSSLPLPSWRPYSSP